MSVIRKKHQVTWKITPLQILDVGSEWIGFYPGQI